VSSCLAERPLHSGTRPGAGGDVVVRTVRGKRESSGAGGMGTTALALRVLAIVPTGRSAPFNLPPAHGHLFRADLRGSENSLDHPLMIVREIGANDGLPSASRPSPSDLRGDTLHGPVRRLTKAFRAGVCGIRPARYYARHRVCALFSENDMVFRGRSHVLRSWHGGRGVIRRRLDLHPLEGGEGKVWTSAWMCQDHQSLHHQSTRSCLSLQGYRRLTPNRIRTSWPGIRSSRKFETWPGGPPET